MRHLPASGRRWAVATHGMRGPAGSGLPRRPARGGGDLMPNDGNLLIGAALGSADAIADCFAGAICEVAVMRRFATEEEIHAIYTAGSPAIR